MGNCFLQRAVCTLIGQKRMATYTSLKDLDMSAAVPSETKTSDNECPSGAWGPLLKSPDTGSKRTLNTFRGVFAPVMLSMLSSIFFLRIGYIVGNAGLLVALAQFVMAYAILVSTVLSICAIVTNGAIEAGGLYFMISRTLGVEFGGSVGILFWFASLVSSAMSLSACAEGIVGSFGPSGRLARVLPANGWYPYLYSSTLNTFSMTVCMLGAALFGQVSVLVLGMIAFCIMVSMVSFFTDLVYMDLYNGTTDCALMSTEEQLQNCTKLINGTFKGLARGEGMWEVLADNLMPKYEHDCSDGTLQINFSTVFGVLFSNLCGITSGANMPGKLLTPSKSVPMGTLSALLLSFFAYVILSTLTAMTCSVSFLQYDCMYLIDFSLWPANVAIGIFLATFSASLNDLISSSQILQALANDALLGPLVVSMLKVRSKEDPVAPIVVSWAMVQIFLLMGSLNKIGQLTTVLYLLSYGALNIACFELDVASAPNFRPTFRFFSWHTCLVGIIGSGAMMFLVSPLYSAMSLLLCLSLVFVLNFYSPKQDFGSISQALLFHQVRKYLLMLDPRKSHIKFWRPQILLLVQSPHTCCALIDFVNALKKGGLYVLGHVYVDNLTHVQHDPCVVHMNHWLNLIDHLGVKAFAELTMSSTLRDGVQNLVRISGLGAMKPNTVIIGFRDNTFHGNDFTALYSPYTTFQFEGIFPAEPLSSSKDLLTPEEYVGILSDILKMHKNLCISRHFQTLDKASLGNGSLRENLFRTTWQQKPLLFLDVWLVDFFSPQETDISDTTCMFLLQLACIVKRVPKWDRLGLRIFALNDRLPDPGSGNASPIHQQETMIRHMLELLRIPAETHVLPNLVAYEGVTGSIDHLPEGYLDVSNSLVRSKSSQTAVIFLCLPKIPTRVEEHRTYLNSLARLTDNWPPTLLVRGVSPVTSITL